MQGQKIGCPEGVEEYVAVVHINCKAYAFEGISLEYNFFVHGGFI